MTARVLKRSLSIAGHRTSISLEEAFWAELKAIAAARGVSLAGQVAEIDETRRETNLSSAIRVFILQYLKVSAQALPADVSRQAAPPEA